MNDKQPSNRRVLGSFMLAMISVAAIASMRVLPTSAEFGLASVSVFIWAAIVFFIPTALVSAELATIWPKTGGIYLWIKAAFGPRWGFLGIWLQWIQNVIWYPTVLAFTGATLAFAFNPALAKNKLYTLAVILIVYWGATFANFLGMKTSGWISTVGTIVGTILPGIILIILGIVWLFTAQPDQIQFATADIFPDFASIKNLVFVAGVVLAFGGMELSAVHAEEAKNPQRDYPRAILLSTIIILLIFILGTLAVSVAIPKKEISLVAGVMQSFKKFLDTYGLKDLVPVIALLLAIGAIAQVSTWIVGPSKGLLASARHGILPPFFRRLNKNGMPVNLMIIQGLIVSALSLVFLFLPTVSSSYWILTALTAQLYLIMYLIMFSAAIYLRYKKPDLPRAYKVPGGLAGMWIVAGLGFLGALTTIVLGFIPPAAFRTGNPFFFDAFLIIGIIIFVGLPLLIYQYRKPSWVTNNKRGENK